MVSLSIEDKRLSSSSAMAETLSLVGEGALMARVRLTRASSIILRIVGEWTESGISMLIVSSSDSSSRSAILLSVTAGESDSSMRAKAPLIERWRAGRWSEVNSAGESHVGVVAMRRASSARICEEIERIESEKFVVMGD